MISVIIPVYNAESYIQNAVESALKQPETGEVILVEDKSPDRSFEVCKSLTKKYSNVILLQHHDKKNHGAGASRNLGIKNAKYDYIAFLDADDYYIENRFKKDVELFINHPDIDGVYNALGWDFYDTNAFKRYNNVELELTTLKEFISPEELFDKISPIGKSGYFSLDTLTVKKDLLFKCGLFNEELRLSQDTDLILKMAALGKLYPGIIDSPVAYRGVHVQNRIQYISNMAFYRPLLFLSLISFLKYHIAKSRMELLLKCFISSLIFYYNNYSSFFIKKYFYCNFIYYKAIVKYPLFIFSRYFFIGIIKNIILIKNYEIIKRNA